MEPVLHTKVNHCLQQKVILSLHVYVKKWALNSWSVKCEKTNGKLRRSAVAATVTAMLTSLWLLLSLLLISSPLHHHYCATTLILQLWTWSQDSSVSKVTRLQAGWLGFNSRLGQGFFYLCCHVQTGSGAHPASYPVGTGCSFPWGELAMAWGQPLTSIQCQG
jgi:hypothetical protein